MTVKDLKEQLEDYHDDDAIIIMGKNEDFFSEFTLIKAVCDFIDQDENTIEEPVLIEIGGTVSIRD